MTGLQSTLGDDGIAEELAANQRSISVAEFFEKNKHMLGFDSDARAIITAIKEGVDNALDATEEAEILPDLYVEIKETGDYYTLILEDNGPGIPKSNVPKVFGKLLYGSRFGSMSQSRGQQGIGISAAVLYSQLTSGKPVKITSRPKGSEQASLMELTIDTDTNEPKIHSETDISWDRPHGTRIEMEMEANMRARSRLYDYITATAVVNPHARITFMEPNLDEPRVFERGADELPQKPEEIRPHPHGVELGHVIKMLNSTDSNTLSGFLQAEFTKVGKKSSEDILAHFRDEWFGREFSLNIDLYGETHDEDEDVPDLEDVIIDAASNKGADSKEQFAEEMVKQMEDLGRVCHSDIKNLVHEVAESVEDGFAITYGSTVRENITEAVWNAIRDLYEIDIHQLVQETTVRKDDEAVESLAFTVGSRLSKTDTYRASFSDVEDFVKAGAERAAEKHDETFGDTSQEKILNSLWEAMHAVSDKVPLVREAAEDRDIVSALLTGMKRTKVNRPSTKCLSPITPENIEAGLRKEYNAEFYSAATRSAGVHSGHPFIVEAGLAYGGDIKSEGSIDLLRFANRVPLVYQPGACGITQRIGSMNWRNYKLKQSGGSGLPEGPVILMIHVASTNVPFTSESKDALASVPDIEDEVEQAVREVARDMKKYLKKQKSLQKRKRKQNVIADILPTMADKLSETAQTGRPSVDGSLARVMNNMLVKRDRDGDDVTVTLSNHTGGQKTFTVVDFTDCEPDCDNENVTITEMDGEWAVRWRGPVRKNGTETFAYTVDSDVGGELSFEDIESEQITVVG